ncbi:hypothetical protein ABBQ32_002193 [Trebouxia sp. C0010 RCD-2024]
MIIWISLEVLIEMSQLPSSILDVLDLVLDPDRLNATDRTTRVIRLGSPSTVTSSSVKTAELAHNFSGLSGVRKMASLKHKITDKMVEKLGVQRTPGANPEMYKSDDYSVHLKGNNQTPKQQEREIAEQKTHNEQGGDPAVQSIMDFKAT